MSGDCHLGGIGVLVTRPAAQALPLCELIEQHHGRPIRFPTLEIEAAPDTAPARRRLAALADGDILLFVSANAVDWAFPLLPDELPLELEIGAVGPATAQRLDNYGLTPTLVPEQRFDSEGLLALPQLAAVDGRRVVIVRGTGGRPKLGEELRARGAAVDYAEVYRTVIPQRNPANLIGGWDRMVDVVLVTSSVVFDNLLALLGDAGAPLLRTTPLLVPGERVARHVAAAGCERIHTASSATDADLLAALCAMVAD